MQRPQRTAPSAQSPAHSPRLYRLNAKRDVEPIVQPSGPWLLHGAGPSSSLPCSLIVTWVLTQDGPSPWPPRCVFNYHTCGSRPGHGRCSRGRGEEETVCLIFTRCPVTLLTIILLRRARNLFCLFLFIQTDLSLIMCKLLKWVYV